MAEKLMLSPLQQGQVWEGWLSSEVRSLYFADMCHHYQRTQRLITWATLAASSGAAVALLAELPPIFHWFRPVLTLGTAALSLWSLVANYNKNASECSDLTFRWTKLSNEFSALWMDMYADDAVQKLADLKNKEAELAKSSTSFPNHEKRMRRWFDHVIHQHRLELTA